MAEAVGASRAEEATSRVVASREAVQIEVASVAASEVVMIVAALEALVAGSVVETIDSTIKMMMSLKSLTMTLNK